MKRSPLVLLLLPALAFADAPALECHGAGGAKDRDLRFAVTLTGLTGNSVVVDDLASREACSCNFRHENFFDQSKGRVQRLIVKLKYQSCDAGCSRSMKRRMNASIDVYHYLHGARSHATPFAGNRIANCDRFSMELPALRRIETERIDAMDETPEFKRRLKGLKGLDAEAPVPEPTQSPQR